MVGFRINWYWYICWMVTALVFGKVKDEDEDHECGRGDHPADVPVPVDPESDHLFDAVVDFLSAEEPTDGDSLEEDAPQERHSAGRVKVHQLEDVDAAVGDHGDAQDEHEDDHAEGEQHQEEEARPKTGGIQLQHHLWVDEECQSRSGFDDVSDFDSFFVRHVSQDGEDDGGGEEGGEGVDAADGDGVAVAVVVELVVGSEGEESADANAVREEDLGASVDPALAVHQSVPVRCEEKLESLHGSGQSQSFDAQDAQDAIRENGREPDDLS